MVQNLLRPKEWKSETKSLRKMKKSLSHAEGKNTKCKKHSSSFCHAGTFSEAFLSTSSIRSFTRDLFETTDRAAAFLFIWLVSRFAASPLFALFAFYI
jgi:hypothetical protein